MVKGDIIIKPGKNMGNQDIETFFVDNGSEEVRCSSKAEAIILSNLLKLMDKLGASDGL